MQTIGNALKPFFAIWKTSLMGSDLENLRSISKDKYLRNALETLIIEDDCEKLDPWAKSELPSLDLSYDIWPRNDADNVITSEIGIADLIMMIQEKLLCPKTIKIHDYRMCRNNFDLYPEMGSVRDLVGNTAPDMIHYSTVGRLARDIVKGTNLTVTFLAIRYVNRLVCDHGVLGLPRFKESGGSLGSPSVSEAVIELSSEHQGQEIGFSMLRSAELSLAGETATYWMERIFHEATTLKTLTLSLNKTSSPLLTSAWAIPKLTEIYILHARVSGQDIKAMLASSKESLTHIRLRQVTLSDEMTWREVLSFIAKEYQALTCFDLSTLRKKTGTSPPIDFRDVKTSDVPEECRLGLELIEKGPPHNKRVTRLSYNGPNAGKVLEIIASHGKPTMLN